MRRKKAGRSFSKSRRRSFGPSRPKKPVVNLSTLAKRMKESGVEPDQPWQECVERRTDELFAQKEFMTTEALEQDEQINLPL